MMKKDLIIGLALAGTSYAEIASSFGYKLSTVYAVCARSRFAGIDVPRRPPGQKPSVKPSVAPKIPRRRPINERNAAIIAMRQEGGTSEDIAAAFGITRNVVDNVLVLARQSGATVLKLKSGPKGSRKAGAMPIAA